MGVPLPLDQEFESGVLFNILVSGHLHLTDVELTSSFGQHALCLAHCSGQRFGGGDKHRIFFFSLVYNKSYPIISTMDYLTAQHVRTVVS